MFRLYGYVIHQAIEKSFYSRPQYATGFVVAETQKHVEEYVYDKHGPTFQYSIGITKQLVVTTVVLDSALAQKILTSTDLLAAISLSFRCEPIYHKVSDYRSYHAQNAYTASLKFVAANGNEIRGSSLGDKLWTVYEVPKKIVSTVYGKNPFSTLPSQEIPASKIPEQESGPLLVVERKKLGDRYITKCSAMYGEGKKALLNSSDGSSCTIYDVSPFLQTANTILVEQKDDSLKVTALYSSFTIVTGVEIVSDGAAVFHINSFKPPASVAEAPAKKTWLSWLFG
ncbi:hypothetical protein KBC79_05495 [Candidatus Woesebacteria bacterium]|nr:hypothetical protein [Candidatus Woesebacteria bacterium]